MDEAKYISSYAKLIGLKEEDVQYYIQKKSITALITNADELLKTKTQREKHKAFLDLYRMSSDLKRTNPQLSSPEKVAKFMHSVMEHIHDKEAVVVAFLDTKTRVLDYEEISLGTLNSSLIHPREIFRKAIINKADSIIVCHNHPSGDVSPSQSDINVTNRLQEVGEIMGIKMLDHVIVNNLNKDDFYSFRENSLIKEHSEYNFKKRNSDTTALNEENVNYQNDLGKKLEEGVKEILKSENFKSWLDTSSHLIKNNYSLRNAILIYLQKPEATYAMGYEKWKEYGRNVKQGAKAAQIFIPVMAYERTKGHLYKTIIGNLKEQIKQNPNDTAVYKVGLSMIEFTMNSSEQVGLRISGKEKTIFPNNQEVKKFISSAILGKIPMYYSTGSVFDVKDTIIPEYLFVKHGFTNNELVKDENGNPIKNKRNEFKIINTEERQAKFNPKLVTSIKENDSEKMTILYESLKSVSERNGIRVNTVARINDESLKNGADGYYSREFTVDTPKGFITISDDLSLTQKCTVLLHEMGHSDLHRNLGELAKTIDENTITYKMAEIQAEAVSYATAKQFGIETETNSFQYLAAYTSGFDLQDLQKSLNTIYTESQKLIREISAELEIRNLTIDLEEIPVSKLGKNTIETISSQYERFAIEQYDFFSPKKQEIQSLVFENKDNIELLDVITEQNACIDRINTIIELIHKDIEKLQLTDTRYEQNEIITHIESLKRQLISERTHFSKLSESFLIIASEKKQSLKDEFLLDSHQFIEKLKKNYPEIKDLSLLQCSYLAKSEYVKKEYSNLLKNNVEKFVKETSRRADAINKIISKNGSFVEVKFCEQWTDKPIMLPGAMFHPKTANTIIKQAEAQINKLRTDAENSGNYFPYSKCNLTVFTKSIDKSSFSAYNTTIDIGDGLQKSLLDHLEKNCNNTDNLLPVFKKSILERNIGEKSAFNVFEQEINQTKTPEKEKLLNPLSKQDWIHSIAEKKGIQENFNSDLKFNKSKGITKEN